MTATLLYKIPCTLGEGAFWHEARRSFFWVDIDGQYLYEYPLETGAVKAWDFPRRISMIARDANDQLIIAGQGALMRFDPSAGVIRELRGIEKDKPDIRTNDGGIDAAGRLWIGTMHVRHDKGAGSLFCIDTDLSMTLKVNSLAIPNGLVWSLDGKRMYHIDSPTGQVQAYAFDVATGEIVFERTAIVIPEGAGSPDGMCIDAEGMLWIAHWNGFGVYRWDPETGKMLGKIEVPVPQVSSCVFGGDSLEQLFITTARENMSPADIKKYPDSGSVFTAVPGVKGVSKKRFGG